MKVYLKFIETYFRYLDYYSLTSKMMITMTRRAKLIDVKVIFNTKVKVNVIILNVAMCFKILITYSLGIALKTILSNKSRFIKFIDNVSIIIKNLII